MNAFVLLILALACLAFAQTCEEWAACCTTLDFEQAGRTATADSVSWQGQDVVGNVENTYESIGIRMRVREIFEYTQQPYPLAIFNASQANLVQGGEELFNASLSHILSAFYRLPDRLLYDQSTIQMMFEQGPGGSYPCVVNTSIMHSYSYSQRMSAAVSAWKDSDPLESKQWIWSASSTQPYQSYTFQNAFNVSELQFSFWGSGYGAVASVRLCFDHVDECGTCGGLRYCRAPGMTCDFMPESDTAQCHTGIYDENGVCTSSYSNQAEVCDGLDNNCNGEVDEGGVCIVPSPIPSQTPTPSRAPWQGPDNLILIPKTTCVRTITPTTMEGVFGYTLQPPQGWTDQDHIQIPVGPFNTLIGAGDWQPQPEWFVLGASVSDAFQISFAIDQEVQWRLDSTGHQGSVQTAFMNRNSPPCEAILFTLEPIVPTLDGCIQRTSSNVCTAHLGYTNPNAQTVKVDSVLTTGNEPIHVFFQGRVREALIIEFNCPDGWHHSWAITTLGNTQTVRFDGRNMCA